MKDLLEFDSETIFKLEALLANSVAINKELEQKLRAERLDVLYMDKKLAIAIEALESIQQSFHEKEMLVFYWEASDTAKEALAKIDPERGPLIN